jgi:hypothetical protein
MNRHQKHLSACLIALAALLSTGPMAWAATTLGTASTYAALAGGTAAGAVTCTTSTVTGDVGVVSPGTFVNTGCTSPGGGTITVNSDATAAYADFLSAYATLKSTRCDQTLTGTLSGVTLTPGVYCFVAAATLTGTLTLNGPADGVWIFKIGTGGTGALTGTNFSMVMAGGGVLPTCNNVYWWVADAATMTTSNFQGTILAGADITTTGGIGGTFNGGALAGGAGSTTSPIGAVTLTTGTIANSCGGGTTFTNRAPYSKSECNQGVGNGSENCDPGQSDKNWSSTVLPWGSKSNDENGGTPGNPGRKGGHK